MIKLYDFDLFSFSGISYGGHGGSKKGIVIDNENWFLKYPKSTKSMEVEGLSYNTSPLSEYIGSKIYSFLGIDVHQTLLGSANGKMVVACKDFLSKNEVIIDYNSIKNEYDETLEKEIEKLSSSLKNAENDIDELMLIMENNQYFKSMPELKRRFWYMFVIDAFISNNDRNEGNWGLILNKETSKLRIAPVYDNGSSFYNKSDDNKLERIYNDEVKFKQCVYESSICIFSKDEKIINPLKFIESMNNEECNKAIIRLVPNIDFKKIELLFSEIPFEFNGIKIFSEMQRKFYFESLKYKYDNVLLPIYNKLIYKEM